MSSEAMDTRAAMGWLLRFVALLIGLGTLAYVYGDLLGDMLSPVFRVEINWLDDTYRIDRLFVDTQGGDKVLRIVVGLARCVVVRDRAFCADPRAMANASTLLGNVALPAVLMMAIALSWPAKHPGEYLGRLLVLPAALALMWALDVPFVLWSALWSMHVDAFAPDLFSPLLIWSEFLQSGGRLALAALLGVAAVGMPRTLAFLWARRQLGSDADRHGQTVHSASLSHCPHQSKRMT